jgi:hypothetical protein
MTAAEDREFLRAFEACEVAPKDFDHAAHVRLAYIYLCERSVDASVAGSPARFRGTGHRVDSAALGDLRRTHRRRAS